ncbi:MAG TPA: PadR family transcriptional regulator [Candidatus Syntrophosphaera sp.]|jgi:DNA-binding PadR family transcriptional regulator|nr:PadR family transcriptional regulator [Candidatus Syntrophosphaera sp.]
MSVTSAEAALLGLLCEGDKHPYQIEKDVQFRDMRFWTELSTSTIYKTLVRLEKMDLLESVTEISEQNRARKVYRITPEGREDFQDALRELLREPEHLRWQADVAFYNLGALETSEQLELLSSYKTALEKAVTEFRELEKFMLDMQCPVQHVSIARRWTFLAEGEIRWVDDFIGRLQ